GRIEGRGGLLGPRAVGDGGCEHKEAYWERACHGSTCSGARGVRVLKRVLRSCVHRSPAQRREDREHLRIRTAGRIVHETRIAVDDYVIAKRIGRVFERQRSPSPGAQPVIPEYELRRE